MSNSGDTTVDEEMEPDLAHGRQASLMAHGVVIKLKEMGLPGTFDDELATLSTDLGDLWSANKVLTDRLEGFLRSPHEWQAAGDYLVDLRAVVDHIGWHVKSVRRSMSRITHFAYKEASREERATSRKVSGT